MTQPSQVLSARRRRTQTIRRSALALTVALFLALEVVIFHATTASSTATAKVRHAAVASSQTSNRTQAAATATRQTAGSPVSTGQS
jgi:hypothetical protein